MINYTVTWTLSNLATNDYVAKSYHDEFKYAILLKGIFSKHTREKIFLMKEKQVST